MLILASSHIIYTTLLKIIFCFTSFFFVIRATPVMYDRVWHTEYLGPGYCGGTFYTFIVFVPI